MLPFSLHGLLLCQVETKDTKIAESKVVAESKLIPPPANQNKDPALDYYRVVVPANKKGGDIIDFALNNGRVVRITVWLVCAYIRHIQ